MAEDARQSVHRSGPLVNSSLSPTALALLRAGDDGELECCYRREAPALLTLARRLTGNRADAEDVVHDVFVGLPAALKRYEERGQFSAWLRRVTVRVALMHQRRVRRRQEESLEPGDWPTAAVHEPADVAPVERALMQLTPTLRDIFVLKVIEGYSHAEIGAMLGISVSASEVRLVRAVKQLREILGGTFS